MARTVYVSMDGASRAGYHPVPEGHFISHDIFNWKTIIIYFTGPVASLPVDSRVLTGTSVPSRLDMFRPATRRVTPAETNVMGLPPVLAVGGAPPGSDKMKQPGWLLSTAIAIPAPESTVHHDVPAAGEHGETSGIERVGR